MYVPAVGDAVEVEIPDVGFEDSRWEALVLSVDKEKGTARVQFKDLMEEEDSDKKLEEEHEFSRMMPPALNDSATPLQRRDVGDSVDCWYEGGWWKGVIYIACEDGVLVYFPSTPRLEEIKGVTQKSMEEVKERVRTGLDWESNMQAWTKRPMQILDGSRDFRKKANKVNVKKEEGVGSGDDGDDLDACQNFSVADFLEQRVPYPIETMSKSKPMPKLISNKSPPMNPPKNIRANEGVNSLKLGSRSSSISAGKRHQKVEPLARPTSKPPVMRSADPGSTSKSNGMRLADPGLLPTGGRWIGQPAGARPIGRSGGVRELPGAGRGQVVAQSGVMRRVAMPQGGVRQNMSNGGGATGRLQQATRPSLDLTARGGGQSLIQGARRRVVKPPARRPPPQTSSQAKSIFPTSGANRIRRPTAGQPWAQPNLGPRPIITKTQRDVRHATLHNEPSGYEGRLPPPRPRLLAKVAPKTSPRFDYVAALNRRDAAGWYLGWCPGVKICVDGLGWAYEEPALRSAFMEQLNGVEDVHFASEVILGSGRRYSGGYACITFPSIEYAVKGMIDLDSLYLAVPGCPVYRPLIAHFPNWLDNPWGMEDVPGRVKVSDGVVPPHFCQMNTIEFDSAIEWNHLRQVELRAKSETKNSYIKRIVEVVAKYKEHMGEPSREIFGQPRSVTSTRTLWLKAVSNTLTNEDLRSAFEQFDHCCKIHRLIDPVTKKVSGSALVSLDDDKKAEGVCRDMQKYLYVAGGTPRPLDVELMRSGVPEGFESVLDCALERTLGVRMRDVQQKYLAHVKIRKIERMDGNKQKCHQEIRKILGEMAHERAALFGIIREERLSLHAEHEEFFKKEIKQYRDLLAIRQGR